MNHIVSPRVLRCWITGVIALLALACQPPLRAASHDEISFDDAQANFVVICAYYTTWPEDVDPQHIKVLRIGVLGAGKLSDAFATASARARSTWFTGGEIQIRQGATAAELADCHIVLITDTREATIKEALAFFANRPTILVNSSPDFVNRGGSLTVRIERQALAFDVNIDQLRAANVTLSSKFLGKASAYVKEGKRELNTQRKEVRP